VLAGPVPFASSVGGPHSDAAFLQVLKSSCNPGKPKRGAAKKAEAPSVAILRSLKLRDSDVAKVSMHCTCDPDSVVQSLQLTVVWDYDSCDLCEGTAKLSSQSSPASLNQTRLCILPLLGVSKTALIAEGRAQAVRACPDITR